MCDAYAQYAVGRQTKDLAQVSAMMGRRQAKDALKRGEAAERSLRQDVNLLMGAQRTSYAAQGVELSSGSALAVAEDTARRAEEDVIQIRNNAAREAWGYRTEASFEQYQGRLASVAGTGSAISSLLGMAYQYSQGGR